MSYVNSHLINITTLSKHVKCVSLLSIPKHKMQSKKDKRLKTHTEAQHCKSHSGSQHTVVTLALQLLINRGWHVTQTDDLTMYPKPLYSQLFKDNMS
jgi:hypothetical protein